MALMNHRISNKSLTLEAVKQRFEAWRSSRTSRRESIPQHLWQAATGLCREHSISCVSQQLRLSYVDLKRRIPEDPGSPLQFMEIDMGAVANQWQIECDRPDGSRLCVTGNGQPPAIDTVLKAFLS
jgi:hypothetical protein